MTLLFRNRAARQLTWALAILFVVMTAGGLWVMHTEARTMNAALLDRDAAIVGGMLREQPLRDNAAIRQSLDAQDLAVGRAALDAFGVGEGGERSNAFYNAWTKRQLRLLLLWAVAFTGAALTLCLLFMGSIYRHIRAVTKAASLVSQGRPIHLEDTGEGDEAALATSFYDMSARIQHSVDSLQQDKTRLKDFLSDISHQLKTPLSALRMVNEILLSKRELPPDKREQFLALSRDQIDRIDWLIQGLLKIARMEAGVVDMNFQPYDLCDTVDMAVAPFREVAVQQGVSLQEDIPQDIRFRHDGQWVSEAVGNLVKNALEHTPAGGKVRLSASQTPLTVELEVTDTGSGIAKEELPHIFERFYRSSRQSNPTSVGIGLALARQIIERNGGEIYVRSAPGRGSVFHITFLKKP